MARLGIFYAFLVSGESGIQFGEKSQNVAQIGLVVGK
jgi:hypothetical protein